MADDSLVLCDALCYLVNKFGNVGNKLLKPAVRDFYSVEVLADAKVRLLSDINNMNLTQKVPHIPQRRNTAGRVELETDDLFTLFTWLDEQKVLNQLPKYVASSPDNMPCLRLYEGDMNCLMKLLKSMEGRIDEFGSALTAITCDVRALQVWPSLPGPAQPAQSVTDINSA